MTTFMSEHDCLQPIGRSDAEMEIDDLLGKARAATGKDWRVRRRYQMGHWYELHSKPPLFEVLLGLNGASMYGNEFQVINFLSGTCVSSEVVQAFFYGLLAGVRK